MKNNSNTYWTAFYTKPRSEKKAAERLSAKGFDIYCPTRTVLKKWSDRKKKIKEPVFASYLFARVDEVQRQQILIDTSIVCSVFWLRKPVVIRDEEIESIKGFLEEYPEAEGRSIDLERGDLAMITVGPFRGETGVIVENRGSKAVLQIKSLGLELKAEISAHKLEQID